MARIVNLVYSGLIIWFALEALFLPIIPDSFLSYLVIVLGALILFTPVGGPYTRTNLTQKLTRFVSGIFLVVSGILSVVGEIGQYVPQITLYSTAGPIIMILIGIIYFLSGTKTGKIEISAN